MLSKDSNELLTQVGPGRHPGSLHYRVPIDDTHTLIFRVIRLNSASVEQQGWKDLPIDYVVTRSEDGEFHMETFPSQDAMAWETQGPVFDRTSEMLGESDRGITLYRKMLTDQIRVVQQGEDPLALVRDDDANKIIEFVTTEWRGGEE